MKIDLACWERGCPCYDQNEGVDVVLRKWVGLTDEERKAFCYFVNWEILDQIEAKLKEKNT